MTIPRLGDGAGSSMIMVDYMDESIKLQGSSTI